MSLTVIKSLHKSTDLIIIPFSLKYTLPDQVILFFICIDFWILGLTVKLGEKHAPNSLRVDKTLALQANEYQQVMVLWIFLWLSACSLSQIDQSHLCRIWKTTPGTSARIG